ncbi:MAG: HlyD family secretion protein [Planctomycetaceae bacterium]|nr:HlyD family secretion protein [Planctomycetaceae bacterium]
MSISHPSAIAQSEVQIRALLNEIAQLSNNDIPPDEFHAEFLRRVVAALGAVGGALWILDGNALALAYQINFKELHLPEGDTKHARLLSQLLHSPDTGTLLPPHSGTEGGSVDRDRDAGNPTDALLICCPIRTELETVGLVEIIHRPDAPVAVQNSFVLFLAQSCRFATDYYKNRQLRHFGERQHLWTALEDFTRTIHQSLEPKQTAYTVANEGRRLIGCDRVSVALRSGSVCPISAVSGQDIVNKRSTTVRLLSRLATAVLKAGEPIWYSGDTADFPPQIERAIEKYVDESHSKMIAVHPLFSAEKENKEEDNKPGKKRQQKRPFGVLIVEQITDSQITERTRKRIDTVAEHAGSALGNALEHQSIFLLPLWKLLGKSKKLVSGEMLPKTIAVTTLIVALLAVLLFMPWKFQMHCTGKLEPILRQRVYSPLDAEIKQLFVDHGTPVVGPADGYRGTTLVELRSPDLEEREIQLRGEERTILEQIDSHARMLLESGLNDYQRAELLGKQRLAQNQLETVQHKLHNFTQWQKPDLYITSPRDGVVVSLDVRRRLTEKLPISRMQYVMEIANLEGPWQLELLMPEKQMGYITEQLRKNPDKPLQVEFRLATDATTTYYGTVTKDQIHLRAEVRSDTGGPESAVNTVAIKVALDEGIQEALVDLEALRPGAAVSARIDCGTRPLGYVLFYEVIAFVQKNVLFRWF